MLVLAFAGVVLPLWGFAELADEVREGEPFAFDEPLLHGLYGLSSPALDRFMLLGSELGYAWGVIPVDIVLAVALLATKRLRRGLFFVLAVGGSALLNLATKALFQRERPALWDSIAPETTFSFPSGHAMGSMTLAAALVVLLWPTRLRWPMLVAGVLFAVWVGSSRVYLGVHYPSDILAGWGAAAAWVCAMVLLVRPHRRRGELPDAGDAR